jgi:MoaA/NifB/PqqE/SkfB family radical SAM enzyme
MNNKIQISKGYLLSKLGFPRIIAASVAITNRCNLKCIYCYGNYPQRKATKNFTFNKLIDIFDELIKQGAKQIFLTGGEPLLRMDFEEIVKYLSHFNIRLGLVTNGVLLRHKNIDTIKKFSKVVVSLDGPPYENNLNRGDTFDYVMEGVDLLHQNNINFSFKMVVNKNNQHCLNYLIGLANQYNTDVETILPYEFDYCDQNQFLNREEKLKFLEAVCNTDKVMFTHGTHNMCKKIFETYNKHVVYDHEVRKKDRAIPNCFCGKDYLFIDANGDVYPCNQIIDNFKPLNLHEQSLDECIKNARNKTCRLCIAPFLNESRYLFGGYLSVIFETIKNIILKN